jgi:hypothetical protein
LLLLLILLGVAGIATAAWALWRVASVFDELKTEAAQTRTLQLLLLFAPGVAAAADDPAKLLVWHPLAAAARRLFTAEFAALDRAAGGAFPFSAEAIEQAHARWTADWLAWERAHDQTYKFKAAEADAAEAPTPTLKRARQSAVETEKLELYQARYGQYVRVGKALQGLLAASDAKKGTERG